MFRGLQGPFSVPVLVCGKVVVSVKALTCFRTNRPQPYHPPNQQACYRFSFESKPGSPFRRRILISTWGLRFSAEGPSKFCVPLFWLFKLDAAAYRSIVAFVRCLSVMYYRDSDVELPTASLRIDRLQPTRCHIIFSGNYQQAGNQRPVQIPDRRPAQPLPTTELRWILSFMQDPKYRT